MYQLLPLMQAAAVAAAPSGPNLEGYFAAMLGAVLVIAVSLLIRLINTHGSALKNQGDMLIELMTLLTGFKGSGGLAEDHARLSKRVHKLSNRQHALAGRHGLLAQRVKTLDGQDEPARRSDDDEEENS